MGGRRHHRSYARSLKRSGGQPLLVQGQRYGADAGRGVQRAVLGAAGVLDPDIAHPARVEHESEQCHRLRDPGDHDDPLRIGDHTTAPGEKRGEGGAQPGQPARIRVTQCVVREFGENPALRGGPRGAREQRQVRRPRYEVGAGVGGSRREITYAWPGRPHGIADPGPGTPAAAQIPLRGQLLVRLRDQSPGHPEIGGEFAAGGQPGARCEPARTDRLAQRLLQRAATRACRCRRGRQEQLPGGGPGADPDAPDPGDGDPAGVPLALVPDDVMEVDLKPDRVPS